MSHAIIQKPELKNDTAAQIPPVITAPLGFVPKMRKQRGLIAQWHKVHGKLVCQWHVLEHQ